MLKRRDRAGNRPGKRPSQRMHTWWVLWRVPILTLIVMLLWWFIFRPIASEQGYVEVTQSFSVCGAGNSRASQACVIDGDTLAIGFGSEGRRIRLIGFDAPELDGDCPAERDLARQATTALQTWLDQGPFEWNGADEPPYDRYGRELRAARRSSESGETVILAEWMIGQGLAAESGWGSEPKDWCER